MKGKPVKNNIAFSDFLFKMGDDYLSFLRNLTPTILFFSLGIFALPKVHFVWDFDEILFAIFAVSSIFIAICALAVNIVLFCKRALRTIQQLRNEEINDQLNFWQTITLLWQESDAKLIIFFCTVTLVAITLVMVFGMNYAFGFYRNLASLGD